MGIADTIFRFEYFNYKKYKEETIDTDITYFDMFKEEEKIFQKDIYDFDEKELTQILLKIKSSSTLKVVSSMLRQYLEYAYKRGKITKLYDITEIIEKNNIKNKVKNMELFQGYILNRNELYNIVNNIIYNKRDAVIFVLLYEGLLQKEVINLKIDQVDFENNRIVVNAKKILENIDKRSMQVISDAIKETECYDGNGKSLAKNPTTQLSSVGNFIVKVGARQNNKRSYQLLNVPIRALQPEINKLIITATRIRYSGMFDYIRTLEHNSVRKLIYNELKEVVKKYGYEGENPLNTNSYISNVRSNYNDFINISRPSDDDLKLFEEQYLAEEKIKEKEKQSLKKQRNKRIAVEKQRSHNADKNTWVDDNEQIGKKGEIIVQKYLSEIYGPSNVIDMNDKDDFDGYDILLMTKTTTERVEVKTTRNLNSPIHISINQLSIAKKYELEYCIYIVYNPFLKKDEELTDEIILKSKIYKIMNPIKFFELDLEFLQKPMSFRNCIFELEKFKVFINKECIEHIEPLVFYLIKPT